MSTVGVVGRSGPQVRSALLDYRVSLRVLSALALSVVLTACAHHVGSCPPPPTCGLPCEIQQVHLTLQVEPPRESLARCCWLYVHRLVIVHKRPLRSMIAALGAHMRRSPRGGSTKRWSAV
jgi:hypothetical protein